MTERLTTEEVDGVLVETHSWTFIKSQASSNPELVNLAPLLDTSVLQLRKEVPLQLVVNMFQKMVSILALFPCLRDWNRFSESATHRIFPSGKTNGIGN